MRYSFLSVVAFLLICYFMLIRFFSNITAFYYNRQSSVRQFLFLNCQVSQLWIWSLSARWLNWCLLSEDEAYCRCQEDSHGDGRSQQDNTLRRKSSSTVPQKARELSITSFVVYWGGNGSSDREESKRILHEKFNYLFDY